LSVPDIGRELKVGTVMEGSVRYEGNRVRITAQLIDVKTGAHLWSEAYDRDLKGIFAIQSDIALKITEAMKAEFSVAEQEAIAKALTDNPEAYAHYVKAWSFLRGFEATAPIHAELDAAIALDPNFSTALAFKGWLHGWEIMVDFEDSVITPESERFNAAMAEEYAQRALAINPDEAGAYMALSLVDQYHRRWEDALSNAEKAYTLNPNHSIILAQYADRLAQEGMAEKAIELMHRVVALDPQNLATHGSAAFQFRRLERWDLVRSAGQNMVALFPEIVQGYLWVGLAEAYLGNEQAAVEMARRVEKLSINAPLPPLVLEIYSTLGRGEDLSRAYDQFSEQDQRWPRPTREWFRAYVIIGEYEKALDLLEEAIDGHSSPGLVIILRSYYMHSYLDPLRDNPRFNAALRKLGVEVQD
jgi:adenylate cyclase